MKKRKKYSLAVLYQKFGVVVLLAVLVIVASILCPNFTKVRNLQNLLRQIVTITIIASGACFMLVCGQINMAYDGLIPCVGCLSCIIMVRTQNAWIALLGGLIIGAIVGYIVGTIVTRLEIPAFLVTLAISSIASGGIMVITRGTKIKDLGDFTMFGKGSIGPIGISVLMMFLTMSICHILLAKSSFGRKVYAVGGNRSAAIASGIDAGRVIRMVYVIDGVTTALAAVLFMSRLGSGQPNAGQGYAFDAITGAVVGGCSIYGGSGNVLGCLVGACIVGVLNNVLNLMNVSSYWQSVCSGAIILLAVLIDIATKDAASNATKMQMAKSA